MSVFCVLNLCVQVCMHVIDCVCVCVCVCMRACVCVEHIIVCIVEVCKCVYAYM